VLGDQAATKAQDSSGLTVRNEQDTTAVAVGSARGGRRRGTASQARWGQARWPPQPAPHPKPGKNTAQLSRHRLPSEMAHQASSPVPCTTSSRRGPATWRRPRGTDCPEAAGRLGGDRPRSTDRTEIEAIDAPSPPPASGPAVRAPVAALPTRAKTPSGINSRRRWPGFPSTGPPVARPSPAQPAKTHVRPKSMMPLCRPGWQRVVTTGSRYDAEDSH